MRQVTLLCSLALSLSCFAVLEATPAAQGRAKAAPRLLPLDCFVLDFETDDDGAAMPHGAMVDLEYDCNGPVFPIAIAGSVNTSAQDTLAIFDSNVGPTGTDPDLLVGKGNILILQNDSNLSQCPPSSGVYCSHNDDGEGGTITFMFCVPARPSSIVLIDQDLTNVTGSSVVLTDVNGKTRTYSVPTNWTGDMVEDFPEPGWKVLDFTTLADQPGFSGPATASEQPGFDPNAVVTLAVTFSGSGGIDDLSWCQPIW
ncbi:MAG TPA: hypothetical protein VF530_01375 [Planctomycetota bacterium]